MEIEDKSGMRPKLGDTSITLPITFDYSGGRKDKDRSCKMWSIILSIVCVVLVIGTIIGKETLINKALIVSVLVLAFSLFIRYVLLKESKKKESYKAMLETDYKMGYKEIWGIYKVEDIHPYICRFRNGKSGIYIRLNKDVILGKYADSEYQHYEAIADAYNLAGAGKVQMIHIDYMDNVGTDERLEESFVALEDVSNPDIKDLLTDIYSFQQTNIMRRVTTFDVYAFLWTGNDITAWNTISRILNCFLDANYRSYHILNERDLRELTKIIFNLNDFSVAEASAGAFSTTNSSVSSITPISLTDVNGNVTIINKTMAEKEAERKANEEAQEAQKRELKRRKRDKGSKGKKEPSDDIYKDMF